MDSVSQLVLGASIAGVCAPAGHRRKALLLGAFLGTLPDLDVLIDYGDPVSNFIYHRDFSHSLIVLFPFSLALWLILRWLWAPIREAPKRWLAAISLALLTHPILDAHTVYGTQLLWPLDLPPVMWSTIFIIDPLYTLPLLVVVVVGMIVPRKHWTNMTMAIALGLSTAYLGWSWIAKGLIEHETTIALQAMEREGAAHFSVPTPFNTLLWRVVIMTDDGYLEGYRSLWADRDDFSFTAYPTDTLAFDAASKTVPDIDRLSWFSRDFLRTRIVDEHLMLSDLRMGAEPNYVFNFVVAKQGNPHWYEIPTEQIPSQVDAKVLEGLWSRIWSGTDEPH